MPVVAEDLGHITPPVRRLRDELGFPGMVVVQLAFEGGPRNPHRPENHREWSVVYTGTHDHDTAAGWWASLSPEARRATGLPGREPHWELIELALASRARVAVVPAPGRPRAGQRGADERAREGRRQLALAPRAGRPDAGVG